MKTNADLILLCEKYKRSYEDIMKYYKYDMLKGLISGLLIGTSIGFWIHNTL